jgi:hypothetical protein
MRCIKLSSVLILSLILISCSEDKSSNNSQTKTAGYKGGETVDGYTLPPMPPKSANDAMLLGIDTNNNSIRDDVEIYIYNRFQGYTNSKVEREIAMQYARTATQLIQSPETAYEDRKYELVGRVNDCASYYYDTYVGKDATFNEWLKYSLEHEVLDERLDDAIFNTKDRLKAYFKFNASLSGHVYEDRTVVKEACDFDPDPLIEGTLK